MAPKPKAEAAADADRRHTQRFQVEDLNRLTLLAGGRSYQCEVEDISRGGVCLSLDDVAPLASEVVLEHAGAGHFRGRRIWSQGNRIGVSFNETGSDLNHTLRCIQMLMSDKKDRPSD